MQPLWRADNPFDTLFSGHGRVWADGIAVPIPHIDATRSPTDAVELTARDLKNRADHGPSWVRVRGLAQARLEASRYRKRHLVSRPGNRC
jgi:hypothetical protein